MMDVTGEDELGVPIDVSPRRLLPPDQVRRLHCLDIVLQAPYIWWGTHDESMHEDAGLLLKEPLDAEKVIDLAKRFDSYIMDGH
jgi:hypothetical protein